MGFTTSSQITTVFTLHAVVSVESLHSAVLALLCESILEGLKNINASEKIKNSVKLSALGSQSILDCRF